MTAASRHSADADDEDTRRRLEHLKEALASNPNDVELNKQAALAFEEVNDFENAICCWTRIVEQRPNDAEARRTINHLVVQQTIHKGPQEPDEVTTHVTQAIARSDEYWTLGDHSSAERVVQEAVEATGSVRAREYLEDIRSNRRRLGEK